MARAFVGFRTGEQPSSKLEGDHFLWIDQLCYGRERDCRKKHWEVFLLLPGLKDVLKVGSQFWEEITSLAATPLCTDMEVVCQHSVLLFL